MKKMKVAAMVLTSAMLFSTVAGITGCNKKGSNGNGVSNAVINDVEEVTEDSLWYDFTKRELKLVENPDALDYYYLNNFFPTDNGYLAVVMGYTKDDFESYSRIINFDNDMNIVSAKEFSTDMFEVREGANVYFNNISIIGGEACAVVNSFFFDEETLETESSTFLYNIEKDEKIDIEYITSKVDPEAYIDNVGGATDGHVFVIADMWSEKGSNYYIYFGKDGKYETSFDLGKLIGAKEIWGCNFIEEKDGKVTFECYGEYESKIILIDLSDMSAEVQNYSDWDDYEDEDDDLWFYSRLSVDGKEYGISEDGVYCDKQLIMPYSATYVNSNKIMYSELLKASDDEFVMMTEDYKNGNSEYFVFTFTKADTNPNAGKTIVTAGYINYLPEYAAEAISVYNQQSENYFVKTVCYEADMSGYDFSGDWDEEAYQQYAMGQENQMANDLTMDLLGGEGPDIILNGSNYAQLNSENYLYDLSDIINEVDVEIFDNVIDAAKVDDKIYQIPLAFIVNGIFAFEKDVKGEEGFTFDEYTEYVDKVCNGRNPLYYSRAEFLNFCLASMSDEFFDEEGNVSFQNEAFYSLAQYCLDNVPEEAVYPWDDDDVYYEGVGVGYGYSEDLGMVNLYSIDTYLYTVASNKETVGLYGLPSFDGRGPCINVESSIAISAAAGDYEAAKDFVKFFFTPEADDVWAGVYVNPIVVSASDAISRETVDNNNKNYEDALKWSSEAELKSWGMAKFDYSVIDDYNDMLRRASTLASIDTSIQLIVTEEIPSFFAGQKKIEDVAAVIENRAQTVINER